MPKKDFKNNPALAFINNPDTAEPPPQQEKAPRPKGEYWRVCWNIRPEFEEYLKNESWKARKSVTEYVNDLIAADMAAKKS